MVDKKIILPNEIWYQIFTCLDKKSLRNSIGYVTQNPFLFSESILENIKFGNHNASLKEISKAVHLSVGIIIGHISKAHGGQSQLKEEYSRQQEMQNGEMLVVLSELLVLGQLPLLLKNLEPPT